MAQPSSPFEAMSPKLHVKVLSHMSTPEDVLATIRASPAASNAFLTEREQIYAAILEAGLAPEVYRELLAILHARHEVPRPNIGLPQVINNYEEFYNDLVTQLGAWWMRAHQFLQDHVGGAAYSTPRVDMGDAIFKDQIRFMVKLYFCLSKFVNFYPTFVRRNAAQIWPVILPSNDLDQQIEQNQMWPRLTDTEQLRLQRGLLRYELSCRLSGLPSAAMSFPYTRLLPLDEFEEIMCATQYVRDLYDSLRWSFTQELCNHLPELDHGPVDSALDKDGSDERKTATDWLSQSKDRTLNLSSLTPDRMSGWTESVSRLGLVFLDRVTRSSPEDCRELFQGVFSDFENNTGQLSWQAWWDTLSRTRDVRAFGVGPHCNPLIQTARSHSLIRDAMAKHEPYGRLRSLGWVFFDDKTKIRSLGLPPHPTDFSILAWLYKTPKEERHGPTFEPRLHDRESTARFTKEEWEELGLQKYSLKDYSEDYRALSQFDAGARAVVNFTSNHLPKID